VHNRRDAEKPRDNHGSYRDDDRPHSRSTLVQADMHIELNRRTPQGRGPRRSASAHRSGSVAVLLNLDTTPVQTANRTAEVEGGSPTTAPATADW
jgi:hypothetical protein